MSIALLVHVQSQIAIDCGWFSPTIEKFNLSELQMVVEEK